LRIAMIGAPSAVHATGAAAALSDGDMMPFHFLGVPATLPLPEVVARLNELDAAALAGYPRRCWPGSPPSNERAVSASRRS
jgi:hypothetical protein